MPSIKNPHFEQLIDVMQKLRSPDGCPWDKEQTHQTLIPYLIEECYEVIEAIEKMDIFHLREELGDLLLQVVFHAQLASEKGQFTIDDVSAHIVDKLKRRHPHVFGNVIVDNADEVVTNWEAIKALEQKNKNQGFLSSVPSSLPSLAQAYKISKKAAQTGFEWPNKEELIKKINEEVLELEAALKNKNQKEIEEEVGDLFFTLVNWCRFSKIDPEQALRKTNQKFRNRFSFMETALDHSTEKMKKLTPQEWDTLWNQAKSAPLKK